MADTNDTSLIGFDPLAWLAETDQPAGRDSAEPAAAAFVAENNALADHNEEAASASASLPPKGAAAGDSASRCLVRLNAMLSVQSAAKLRETLLEALESSDTIELDAADVVAADAASLQLLLVFKQTALKLGKHVAIDFPSEKFIEAAELLGLAEMLDVDQAAAGLF